MWTLNISSFTSEETEVPSRKRGLDKNHFSQHGAGPNRALLSLRLWTRRRTSCCCPVAQSCLTLWPAYQASLSFTISQSLLKLMSIEPVMPSNHLVLCCPLLLPSIFPSMRVFSNESALHIRWPKYWNFRFSFSISLSNEYLELISFKIHWFYFLAVQGTLKSLLRHHSSKASILLHSAFFIVQLSHPYMKNHSLD